MQYKIQELKLGGILDQAVAVLKNRFMTLMGITLFLYVPLLVVQGYAIHWLMPDTTGLSGAEAAGAAREVWRTLGWAYLVFAAVGLLVAFPLTNAATIYAIANEYLGRPVTAVDSMRYALRVMVPLMLTTSVAWILIWLGLILLLVPGIVLFFRYWFSSYVVVIEGTRGLAALKRSKALMGKLRQGNADKALVLGILLLIISWLIGSVTAFIPSELVAIPVRAFVQALLFVFGAAAGVVFYFSCRCKFEHFDLEMLAEAVEKEGAGREVAQGVAE